MVTAAWDTGLGPTLDVPAGLVDHVHAGVLQAADVHVTRTLARATGEDRPEVLLACALAVRAPRRRHVCVDLATVRRRTVAELADPTGTVAGARLQDAGTHPTATQPGTDAVTQAEQAVDALTWPDPDRWRSLLADSPLVAVRDPAVLEEPDDAASDVAPLTLAGSRLYLDRYWRYERRVATDLRSRAGRDVDVDLLRAAAELADRFDGPAPDRQRLAVASAVCGHLTVLAGGPGTGKTTTVAALLRTLAALPGGDAAQVALAAPTGKAAARLTESLREAADRLPDGPERHVLAGIEATTLHRLLGPRGHRTRFRHDRRHPLPHDLVVVDETSMVPLALLAKLLDAVRPTARLVLVGDPHQLASVEAGSVLGDVVGDPQARPTRHPAVTARLAAVAGDEHVADTAPATRRSVADAVVVLDRVHRFVAGSGVDRLAQAVRDGDADAAVQALRSHDDVRWVETDPHDPTSRDDDALRRLRATVVAAYRPVHEAAVAGDAGRALEHLDDLRVLCAHRRGRDGVAGWVPRIEGWLRSDLDLDTSPRWYVGRPVLITGNDRRARLWNGDLGVVVAGVDRPQVAVPATAGTDTPVRTFAPARLEAVETVHATTVHKAQGSQVRHAVVVLPDPASRLCTRELLYTAVTRAREQVTLVAAEATVHATVAARTQRASGLHAALHGT